jgi:hypothetical protein
MRHRALRLCGWITLATVLLAMRESAVFAAGGSGTADELEGMWNVVVTGSATYDYVYTFSAGGLVTVGNIDANWDGQGSSFGATVGSYRRTSKYPYQVREWTWAFDPQGNPAGHSEFVGTYWVGRNGLSGSGTWTLYDLAGQEVFGEPLTVAGTRLDP